MKVLNLNIAPIILYTILSILVLLPITAEAQTLGITGHRPTIDGKIMNSEYSLSIDIKNGKIFLSRTDDKLYAAIKASTSGWVALGFNTLKMNNSDIIIGYVSGKNKVIEPQKVSGRKHSNADIPYMIKYNIGENNGYTTLEVELKIGSSPNDFRLGPDTLNMIAAYGSKDNLKSYHKFRTPITVNLR